MVRQSEMVKKQQGLLQREVETEQQVDWVCSKAQPDDRDGKENTRVHTWHRESMTAPPACTLPSLLDTQLCDCEEHEDSVASKSS